MKLYQKTEKEDDLNEIDSKYLWVEGDTIERINLSTFTIDMHVPLPPYPLQVKTLIALPNDHIFGMKVNSSNSPSCLQFEKALFIVDKDLNIKPIETPIISNQFLSCCYDNSIFIFQDSGLKFGINKRINPKKYIIAEDKWVDLAGMPFKYARSCVGYKQKVIISLNSPGIWVYDIISDSYSQHYPIRNLTKFTKKILYKMSGKIYLILFSNLNEVYCSDEPFSEWTFLCNFPGNLLYWELTTHMWHKDSFYYVSGSTLWEFSLKEFKLKEIETIK